MYPFNREVSISGEWNSDVHGGRLIRDNTGAEETEENEQLAPLLLTGSRSSTREVAHALLLGAPREDACFSDSAPGVEARARSDPLAALNSLSSGDVFAQRYVIQQESRPLESHRLYGHDRTTNKNVVLNFYASRVDFQECFKARSYIHDETCVSSVVDVIQSQPGYPPCIVVERGDHRLSEMQSTMLDCTAAELKGHLSAILRALQTLHSKGVIHGNLHPDNIAFFNAENSWKLIDGGRMCQSKQRFSVPYVDNKYAAPEITAAKKSGMTEMRFLPATDMWSFGLIAFEVLTRSRILDVDGVRNLIDPLAARGLWQQAFLQLFFGVKKSPASNLDRQNQRFLNSLIRSRMHVRVTAPRAQNLLHASHIIRPWPTLNRILSRRKRLDTMTQSRICRRILAQAMQNRFVSSITVETFKPLERESVNRHTFHTISAEKAFRCRDSQVNEDIYIVIAKTPCRLRIAVDRLGGFENTVEQITAVSVRTKEGSFVKLDFQADETSGHCAVLAFLDPGKEGLEELRRPCPLFGDLDQRYLFLEVKIEVVFEGLLRPETCVQPIWCRVVDLHKRLFRRRVARYVHKFISKLPASFRRTGERVSHVLTIIARRFIGLG